MVQMRTTEGGILCDMESCQSRHGTDPIAIHSSDQLVKALRLAI